MFTKMQNHLSNSEHLQVITRKLTYNHGKNLNKIIKKFQGFFPKSFKNNIKIDTFKIKKSKLMGKKI